VNSSNWFPLRLQVFHSALAIVSTHYVSVFGVEIPRGRAKAKVSGENKRPCHCSVAFASHRNRVPVRAPLISGCGQFPPASVCIELDRLSTYFGGNLGMAATPNSFIITTDRCSPPPFNYLGSHSQTAGSGGQVGCRLPGRHRGCSACQGSSARFIIRVTSVRFDRSPSTFMVQQPRPCALLRHVTNRSPVVASRSCCRLVRDRFSIVVGCSRVCPRSPAPILPKPQRMDLRLWRRV